MVCSFFCTAYSLKPRQAIDTPTCAHGNNRKPIENMLVNDSMAAPPRGVVQVRTRRLTGMALQKFDLKDGVWGNFEMPRRCITSELDLLLMIAAVRRHLTVMTNAKNCSDVVEAS
jgi:hypothetical protein